MVEIQRPAEALVTARAPHYCDCLWEKVREIMDGKIIEACLERVVEFWFVGLGTECGIAVHILSVVCMTVGEK